MLFSFSIGAGLLQKLVPTGKNGSDAHFQVRKLQYSDFNHSMTSFLIVHFPINCPVFIFFMLPCVSISLNICGSSPKILMHLPYG
jgi:hypothetical protein